MKYRADIDGLRAIAIATVLLDHLRVPGFAGGFVGVDVFFVISGFLITTLIAEAQARGAFSLAVFYERRVRRIFPALFVVLAATLVAGFVLMTPADYEDLAKSTAAAAVSGANVFFWSSSGYFAPDAERLALLHTWSLAVEEQFYLFFPWVMIGLAAHPRLPRRATLAGLAAAAFAWSIGSTPIWPEAAFYLLPARAGELLLGALVALSPAPGRDRGREAVALAGLALIVAGVALIDPHQPFPSWRAAVPCLGTALVIRAGRGGGASWTARALALPPLRFLGAISYSLYLWHWPVIVFTRYRMVEPPGAGATLAMLVGSIALATASWWLVERPFRRITDPTGSRAVLIRGAVLALATAALGLGVMAAKGLPGRLPAEIRDIAEPDWGRFRPCLAGITAADVTAGRLCRLGRDGVAPTFLLSGDSFAAALADGLDRSARVAGVAGLFVGVHSCPPIGGLTSGAGSSAARAACEETRALLPMVIAANPIRTVVLHSLWANFDGERPRRRLLAGSGIAFDAPEADPFLARAVAKTVADFGAGGVRVVVVGAVPAAGVNVPATLARARLIGRAIDLGPSRAAFAAGNRTAGRIFAELAARGAITLVEPSEALCDQTRCRVESDGLPLYADGYHLGIRGAERVVERLWPDLGLTAPAHTP